MKKELPQVLKEYFHTHVKLKKIPEDLIRISVKVSEIKMIKDGVRKEFSPEFLEKENACNIEEILTDIVFKTYSNEEVFFLLKIKDDKKEMNYFILRHFRSRKADFYFGVNIMPFEEFNKKKVLKEAVFFYKKK